MENQDRRRTHDQLEEHSLPGTNQAGKGPGECGPGDQKKRPTEGEVHPQKPRTKHTITGTNHVGKGASSST